MSQFDHLSSQEFPFLYALALFDAPLSQAAMLDLLLLRREQFSVGGVVPGISLVREQMAALYEKKMLTQVSGRGYALAEGLQLPVLAHLLQYADVGSWVQSLRFMLNQRGDYGLWKTQNAAFCRRELFFSCLTDDDDGIVHWRQKFFDAYTGETLPLAASLFQAVEGERVFAAFNPFCQGLLLNDLFFEANWSVLDCGAAYHYTRGQMAHNNEIFELAFDQFVWQALLRGDFTTLVLAGDFCPPPSMHLYAFIHAFVHGKYDAALQAGVVLAKQIKVESGKRKVYFDDVLGLVHTACLLTSDAPEHRKQLKEHVDHAIKNNRGFSYFLLESLSNHLAKGVPQESKRYALHRALSVDTLFEALVLKWEGEEARPDAHQRFKDGYALYAERGYTWLAAELDAVLVAHYGDTPRMPGWHTEQQRTPLHRILQREESWQRALSALAQLPLGKNEPRNAEQAEQRLVWLLGLMHNHAHIEPREQKRNAKGVWSKGRPVALKRLSSEPQDFPYLTEQDTNITRCIRKTFDGYYGNTEYTLDGDKALPHLINHPQVMWIDAPDVRIDVLAGEMKLLLKEQQDQIRLQLDPPMSAHEHFVLNKETPTRLVVYRSTPEIKQIAGILGAGLSVPVQAKAQLVDVIAAIAPHLAIHSDLPELAQHLQSVAADDCIYAHLLPLKEGLRLQLLVRPLSEGSWLMPGKGTAHVLGEREGKPVQASRDLAQEKCSVDAILQHCPAFAEAEQSSHEWQWQEPEQCLELLTQLKSFCDQHNHTTPQLELVWPEGERFRLKGQRGLKDMRLSIKKQGEWFVAGGEITLDDGRVLALRELLQLSEQSKGRFLKLGEQDFLALSDAFRKRLEEIRRFAEPTGKTGLRINPLAAAALAELSDEVGELQADSAWRAHIEKLNSLADFTPQVPSTLQAQLRDYQTEGYQWLARLAQWGVGACLADDMGLGKTVQTLALLLDRAPTGPALVIAPISVAMNWQAEAQRFAPTLRVRSYQQNRSLQDLGAFDLVIASYGMLQQDSEQFAAQHWHTIVLDEAQVIKNAATKRSQAAMALQADFKMIASGTPVENHLGELWNLFRFINPGLLGSKESFNEKFALPIERGDKVARTHLKKLIQAFILRRTKTQVLSELPSRTEINLQVELSDQERHLYEALRQEALDKIANLDPAAGKSMQVLAEITKLRRFCCHPALVMKQSTLEGSKLTVLQNTVQELLDNRHKALVFSQFVDHLAIVRAWLDAQNISYQYLDGSTPANERKKRVDAFQAGEGDIFLISLKAGGTGLNLTAADYVIHLDPWWNPAVEDQASDRAHRMGQQRPVTIYRLVTQDTIEEKILALHAEKRELADSLLDGGDSAGRMDTEALLRLLKESV